MIFREKQLQNIHERLSFSPVLAILGPRQCGKTTLARQFSERNKEISQFHFFDLENPVDLARLDQPMVTLSNLEGHIVIDEIQRRPEIFPVLRVIVDQNIQENRNTKFIILGSASQDLLKQSSETLAGRISFLELSGFSLDLLGKKNINKLWFRGAFPLSFLSSTEDSSNLWREDFIRTFLERDIPSFGFNIPSRTLRRFWTMLAHYHGSIFNAAEIGRSIDSSASTVKRYLDLLSATFMIRVLEPYYYNTRKRLVKSPKIYFRDTGLLHSLLGINSWESLQSHPKLGASWEGFIIEEFIKRKNLKAEDYFFWCMHSGAEIDLIYREDSKLYGLEVKYSDAPRLSPSMKNALEELSLERIDVIYPGEKTYKLDKKVIVSPII